MPDPFLVRRAIPRDARAVLALADLLRTYGVQIDARYAEMAPPAEVWRVKRTEAEFKEPAFPCFVAEVDGMVVGFIRGRFTSANTFLISEIYVEPSHRDLNIGRTLVKTLVEHLRRFVDVEIKVSTLARAEQAIAFWQAMGFSPLWLSLKLAADPPP